MVAVPGAGTPTGTPKVMRPPARTSTRSASTSASSTSWVTSSTAGEWRCHSRSTRRCMVILVRASSALNGSSSSSRPGSRTSARASAARWASPPDRVTGQARARSVSPTSASAVSARAAASGARSPRATLARTRRQGSRRGSWNAIATGPGTSSSPVTSRSSPATARSSVDFPVPLTPSRATNSPGAISRSRPSSMRRPSKSRVSPRTWTVGTPTGAGVAAPRQGLPLQEPDQRVGEQAEHRVHGQRDHDHVVAQELGGLADDEPQARVRVDLLGHHQGQPGHTQALPQADQHLRQRAGQDDVPDHLGPAQAERLAGLGQPGVHAADARERVQVQRDRGAQRDQDDLGQLPDAEPHDEHRNQPEQRQGTQYLQQRIHGVLATRLSPATRASAIATTAPTAKPTAIRCSETSIAPCSVP